MTLDATSLEQLLYEEEGKTLDFKERQYQFTKADDRTKSELLKDILAFANTRRGETAYILIGVRERRGQQSKIVGVSGSHLDDASLQQFVHSKTQRPVEFSYYPLRTTDGIEIGVIEIPVQQRPTYLNKSYGKLGANTVYIRRGSSTGTAGLDEIATMGNDQVHQGSPDLVLTWANLEKRRALAAPVLQALLFHPALGEDEYTTKRSTWGLMSIEQLGHMTSPSEAINYVFWNALLRPIGMVLSNKSGIVGKRVQFVGQVNTDNVFIRDWYDRPMLTRDRLMNIRPITSHLSGVEPEVHEYGSRYSITVDFGDVRPRDEIWTTTSLLIGPKGTADPVDIKGELRADNLPNPIPCTLPLKFDMEIRPMTREDVNPYLR